MRTVKVLTTSGIVEELRTSSNTWGQLKQELTTSLENRKVLVGSTKAELSVDEAVLPAGDFRLYLVESKVKSGALDKEVLQEYLNLVDVTTKILRKATILLTSGLKDISSEDTDKIDLELALKSFFEKQSETKRKESPEDLAAIEEIKRLQGEVSEENFLDDEDEDDYNTLNW